MVTISPVNGKRGTNVRPQILAYFAAHPNRPISVSELATKLKDDPQRIKSSIASVIRADRQITVGIIDTRVPGESWVLLTCRDGDPQCDCAIPVLGELKEHPSPSVTTMPTKKSWQDKKEASAKEAWSQEKPGGAFNTPERLFQQIGQAKGGQAILKCEDGTIWQAVQM